MMISSSRCYLIIWFHINFITLNEELSTVLGTYPNSKVIGVALNTVEMPDNEAKKFIKKIEKITGLPATDVIRYGGEKIFNQLI